MAIELRDACNFSGSKPVRPRRGSESKFSRKMEIPGSDQVTPDRPNIIYYQIDPKPKRDICVLPLSGTRSPFRFYRRRPMKPGRRSPVGRGWRMPRMNQAGMRSTSTSI